VILAVVLFVNLGFWQLNRHEERRLENTVGGARYSSEPLDLGVLIAGAGDDIESLVYRRATTEGVYQAEDEVLIRSRVHRGQAGFHVITPMTFGDEAVLVNRGWVPLLLDQVPVEQAPPASGEVTASGWLTTTQRRGPLGPEDPAEGRLTAMSRVDIERIQTQVAYPLLPVVLNLSEVGELPIAVDEPEFDDVGPHLGYAIQWFGFALIGVVGYFFLMRKVVPKSG
jgi:surfeit locus 1 family protein